MAWNLIKTEAFQEDFEELVAYYAIAASKKGLTKFVDSIEGATLFSRESHDPFCFQEVLFVIWWIPGASRR